MKKHSEATVEEYVPPDYEVRMKYKHYPIALADKEMEVGQKKQYKVTTINWSFAGQDEGKVDYNQVHKNEYVMTLEELIGWIRETEEVAEDIVRIEEVK